MTAVAAVIPTHRRPELVLRAVESIRTQTRPVAEIVVVVDGADSDGQTLAALATVDDRRLTVVVLEGGAGPAGARNAGVAASSSPWVGFCDDDDRWAPNRIERQMDMLDAAGTPPTAIVSGGVIARSSGGDQPWPVRYIRPSDRIGEYLFCTRSPFRGETLLHTSTLLASRCLLDAVPFDASLWNHEDWDWLLRAEEVGGHCLSVEEPLAVWHIEDGRAGLGSDGDWQRSLAWAERNRQRLGPRAFSAFCLTVVAGAARDGGSATGIASAVRAAARGRPPLRNVAWLPLYAGLPLTLRRRLRAMVADRRRSHRPN